MHVRFWNPQPVLEPAQELILGPFDYAAIKVDHRGGLTQVEMVDSAGTKLAWLSTIAPIRWYIPGQRLQFAHVMMWEPVPAEVL